MIQARRGRYTFALAVMILCLQANRGVAQSARNLKQLSLEDLMDIDVSSVDRMDNPLSDTAAAVSVLTADDIMRSGATNIPELLRYVPGVDVARSDSDHWSVSIRGFASQFSKYVLVLIDGRIVYTPLFEKVCSGTFRMLTCRKHPTY